MADGLVQAFGARALLGDRVLDGDCLLHCVPSLEYSCSLLARQITHGGTLDDQLLSVVRLADEVVKLFDRAELDMVDDEAHHLVVPLVEGAEVPEGLLRRGGLGWRCQVQATHPLHCHRRPR